MFKILTLIFLFITILLVLSHIIKRQNSHTILQAFFFNPFRAGIVDLVEHGFEVNWVAKLLQRGRWSVTCSKTPTSPSSPSSSSPSLHRKGRTPFHPDQVNYARKLTASSGLDSMLPAILDRSQVPVLCFQWDCFQLLFSIQIDPIYLYIYRHTLHIDYIQAREFFQGNARKLEQVYHKRNCFRFYSCPILLTGQTTLQCFPYLDSSSRVCTVQSRGKISWKLLSRSGSQ